MPDVDVDEVVVADPRLLVTSSITWRRSHTTPGRGTGAGENVRTSVRVSRIDSRSRVDLAAGDVDRQRAEHAKPVSDGGVAVPPVAAGAGAARSTDPGDQFPG